jgi:hypothetical protein
VEFLRRIRDLRGACDSGRAECDEERRTVVGGESLDLGRGGEGVVMEAELEVSGECMTGKFGAITISA